MKEKTKAYLYCILSRYASYLLIYGKPICFAIIILYYLALFIETRNPLAIVFMLALLLIFCILLKILFITTETVMYLRPWHDISINTSLYRKYKEYSLVKKVKRGIIPSMETLRGKGVTDATMETYGFWADMLLTELAGKENASAIEDLKDPGDSIELIPTVPAVGKITVENVGYKGNLQKTFFDLRGKCILRLENPEYYARTYLHYKISISLVPQK